MALEARAGNPQILRETGDYVQVTLYQDGTATNADSNPTVTITRADGTVLATAQASTKPAGTTGIYRYTLTPAQLTDLDLLTARWTAVIGGVTSIFTTVHEVVGGFLFTEAQLRSSYSTLASESKFPDAEIQLVRLRVVDELQTHTGVSWVPRFRRWTTKGDGTRALVLPNLRVNRIQSLSIAGVAQSVGDLVVDRDVVHHKTEAFARPSETDPLNIVIEYDHGYDVITDGVDDVAMTWAHKMLLKSRPLKVDSSAASHTDRLGQTTRRARFMPSGLAYVDAWIEAHDERLGIG